MRPAVRGRRPRGEWLVEVHALEVVSASAFEPLALELARAAAAATLVPRALEAGRDERRHAALARAMRSACLLAEAETPLSAVLERTLRAIALENADEGCVHEACGALLALWRRRPRRSLRRARPEAFVI